MMGKSWAEFMQDQATPTPPPAGSTLPRMQQPTPVPTATPPAPYEPQRPYAGPYRPIVPERKPDAGDMQDWWRDSFPLDTSPIRRQRDEQRRAELAGKFQQHVVSRYGIGHDPAAYQPPEKPIKYDRWIGGAQAMYLPTQRQIVTTGLVPEWALHEYAHDANTYGESTDPRLRFNTQDEFLQNFANQWQRSLTSGAINPPYNQQAMSDLQARMGENYADYKFNPDELYAWGSEMYAANRQNVPDYIRPYYDYWMDAERLPSYMPYPLPQPVPTPPVPTPPSAFDPNARG